MENEAKATNTDNTANCGYTVLPTVPYQKCPVCEGKGEIYKQNNNKDGTAINIGYFPCSVCGGAKIIPMHVINQELLKISSKNYGDDGVGLSSEEISKLL